MSRRRPAEREEAKRHPLRAAVAVGLALGISLAWAQEPVPMPEVNHGSMDMSSVSTQGGSAPPGARDPNAYADGYGFGSLMPPHTSDQRSFAAVLANRFEAVWTDDNNFAAYDIMAWYGKTFDRAVLKAEGRVDDGAIQEARSELLWSHAVDVHWDAQLGVRYDSGVDPSRGWLAFGVEGLAPYWFDVEASAYAGDQGRTALRLAARYELLFTQRLILQPRFEANFYGKPDPERRQGAGLSDLAAGLRLRYEIRREFAPYVGIEWTGQFGATADFARTDGRDPGETRYVAGLRFWY